METATATMTPPTEDTAAYRDKTFKVLCDIMLKRGPEAQKRVVAHNRAVTGRNANPANYHADTTISDEDKAALYILCGQALVKKDYSALQGQLATGDRRAEVADEGETMVEARPEKKKAAQPTTT